MSKHEEKGKYIGIKVDGLNHYLWFSTKKVVEYLGIFCGDDGWGKEGALTHIKVHSRDIKSIIYSESLQY